MTALKLSAAEKRQFIERLLRMRVSPQTIKRCTNCVDPDDVDAVLENVAFIERASEQPA